MSAPTDSPWLTVTEIARQLGRPDSTVRYWRNRYRQQLPERLNDDARPVYPLRLFEQIDAMIARRATPAEIRAALDAGEPSAADEPALRELRVVRAELAQLRAQVERIAAHLGVPADDETT